MFWGGEDNYELKALRKEKVLLEEGIIDTYR